MSPTTIRIGIAQSVVLGGLAALMWANTPPQRSEAIEKSIRTVRAIQETATQWSLEAGRVRADPGANFDGLARFVSEMRSLRRNLAREIEAVPEIGEETARATRAYSAAAEALRERIERFKSTYSVVRNSERYLPIAAADLIEEAHERQDEDLAAETAVIAQAMRQFIGAAEEELAEKLSERMEIFERSAATRPGRLSGAMGRFSAHTRVILEKRGRTDELLKEITSGTLKERAEKVEADLGARQAELEAQRVQMRNMTIGAIAGVPAGWLLLGLAGGRARRKEEEAQAGKATRIEGVERAHKDSERREEPMIDLESALGMDEIEEAAESAVIAQAARDLDERRGAAPEPIEVIETLMGSGTILATMGQTIAAYVKRMGEDVEAAKAARGSEQGERRLRRVGSDVRRLAFFAQRMSVLGRQSASRQRSRVDVNEALERALEANGAREQCTVETDYGARGWVEAAPEEIALVCQIAVEHALHAVAEALASSARIEITTRDEGTKVVAVVTHNAVGAAPGQGYTQFIPFCSAQGGAKGVELACMLHLAKRYGGRASLESPKDGGTKLEISFEGGKH